MGWGEESFLHNEELSSGWQDPGIVQTRPLIVALCCSSPCWACHKAILRSCRPTSSWLPLQDKELLSSIPVLFFELHRLGLAGITGSVGANLCAQRKDSYVWPGLSHRPTAQVWVRVRVLPKPYALRGFEGWDFPQNTASANSKGRNMCWAGENNRCPLHLVTAK